MRLLQLEVAVGLQVVEHGWHKPRPVFSSAQLAAICSKKTHSAVDLLAHQHAQHFALHHLVVELALCHIVAHLPGRLHAERMRLVVERIIELRRQLALDVHRMEHFILHSFPEVSCKITHNLQIRRKKKREKLRMLQILYIFAHTIPTSE